MAVDEALVDTFIATAQKHRTGADGKLFHQRLVDAPPGRREVHQRRLDGFASRLPNCQQRARQRLGQHHHARPAAIRPIVDTAVVVVGEIAQGPQLDVDPTRFERTPCDAVNQVGSEQLGEQ